MKNIAYKIIFTFLFAASVSLLSAHAQQNAETRARQAEIDAGEAKVKMEQIEKNAVDTAGVEGVDAPEVAVDAAEANMEQQRLNNAEEREVEAEREE